MACSGSGSGSGGANQVPQRFAGAKNGLGREGAGGKEGRKEGLLQVLLCLSTCSILPESATSRHRAP